MNSPACVKFLCPLLAYMLAAPVEAFGQDALTRRTSKKTLLSAIAPPLVDVAGLLMPDSVIPTRGLSLPDCVVSPDGRHAAWVWRRGKHEFVMHDGRQLRDHESIDAKSISFSPDSQHLAYFAKDQGRSACVRDDLAGRPYDRVSGRPVFSPDGRHLAYVADAGGRQFVVLDGEEQAPHSTCGQPVFSPDGQHLAYATTDGKKFAWVVDGTPGKNYDEGKWGTFSPEGNRFAYVAGLAGRKFTVVGAKEQKPYYNILSSVQFSPDGSRFAYLASEAGSLYLVLDGKETPTPFSIDVMAFSPDNRHFAYAGGNAKGDRFTVIDGKETVHKEHGFMGGTVGWRGLRFSPDSRHVAFGARDVDRGRKAFVVLDGKEGAPYDEVDGRNLVFSPDSGHFAYLAGIGKKYGAVVDGLEGKRYDVLLPPIMFSADGKHTAYLVQLGKNSWGMVVDGQEGEAWFSVIPRSLRFDSSGSFRYLALGVGPGKVEDPATGREEAALAFYLVEERLP